MNKKGFVSLVGAGPGDLELLTLKGEMRLKNCDVVIYDRLANQEFLNLVPDNCEKINAGKVVGSHLLPQNEINEIIVKKALEGKRVVRLKGGDPFVFGRGGEEVIRLKEEGIPFEVIPGITSAIAAATYAGIPVTHRGVSRSFHVITGHTREGGGLSLDFKNLANLEGTLIFLMGMANLSIITNGLLTHGKEKDTPVAIISNATTKKQKVVKGTLETIVRKVVESQIKAPAIIVVGKVVELDMACLYKEKDTIAVGINGTKRFIERLKNELEVQNVDVKVLYELEVKDFTNREEILSKIINIDYYSWLVFTSSNGVELFMEALKKNSVDFRKLSHIKMAVIGRGTYDTLNSYGFLADYMPDEFTVKALGEGICKLLGNRDKVLIARALRGSKELNEIFDRNNISYTDLSIYDLQISKEDIGKREGINRLNDLSKGKTSILLDKEESDGSLEKKNMELDNLDYITFGSSSQVEAFFRHLSLNELMKYPNIKLVSIGEVTSKTLECYGVKSYLTAKEASVSSIVSCIMEDIDKKEKLNETVNRKVFK